MEVSCDFVGKQLVCMLPNQIMDVLMKVCTKTESIHLGRMYICIHLNIECGTINSDLLDHSRKEWQTFLESEHQIQMIVEVLHHNQ